MAEKEALTLHREIDDAFKELMERKLAVPSFLKLNTIKVMTSFINPTEKHYDAKIAYFAKGMLREFRFRRSADYMRDEPFERPYSFTKYSLDFALRTRKINETYRQRMHGLLKDYIPIKCVVDIISSYSDNGYRWFRLEFNEPNRVPNVQWRNLNQEVVWNLKYDDDDYFRSNEYYKREFPATDKAVSFADWRNELDGKYVKEMSDKELAKFIASLIVCPFTSGLFFSSHCFEENVNWIAQHHK